MGGARLTTHFSYSNSTNSLRWHKLVLPQKAVVMLSPAQCKNRGVEGGKNETTTFEIYKFRLP